MENHNVFIFIPLIPIISKAVVTAVVVAVVAVVVLADLRIHQPDISDNPTVEVAEDPVALPEAYGLGWPTGRDDGTRGFWMYLGAEIIFPRWISCEDSICLVGHGNAVSIYDMHPRIRKLTQTSTTVDSPFWKLVELGLSREQAARLLTP